MAAYSVSDGFAFPNNAAFIAEAPPGREYRAALASANFIRCRRLLDELLVLYDTREPFGVEACADANCPLEVGASFPEKWLAGMTVDARVLTPACAFLTDELPQIGYRHRLSPSEKGLDTGSKCGMTICRGRRER